MSNDYKKSIIIFACILFFITVIFVTYAILPESIPGSIVTNILHIDEEAYGSNVFDSSNLDLKPILDSEVELNNNNVIYISFNVGGAEVNNVDDIIYDIALVDLEIDCSLLTPYLKWKLLKNGEFISEGSFDYRFDTIKNGRLVLTPIQQDLVKYSEDKSKYDRYDFYMWLSDSCQNTNLEECPSSVEQSDLMNKVINGKIEVELYAGVKRALVRNPSEVLDVSTCTIRDGDDNDSD